ncbi:MAG: hypothetical protein HC803_04245 [Saprospiraceae bacterium]|nr:hypothetical protein [Saprospiraceae bacterium]
MKRLPFNTITILWGIVILLASCAFTTKTQKTQSEQSNSTLQPPSKDFIQQLKLRNNCVDENPYATHCYDFIGVDFRNYIPLTFDNFKTTYQSLFDLSKNDDVISKNKMTFNKNTSLGKYSNQDYFQTHKGYVVYDTKGQEYNLRIRGDSLANRVFTASAKLIKQLNVDTLSVYSEKKALIKAKKNAPMENGEFLRGKMEV